MYETYTTTLQDLRKTAGTTIDHPSNVLGLEPDMTFNDWFVRDLLQPLYAEIFKRPQQG
jgi:hypothetical protein